MNEFHNIPIEGLLALQESLVREEAELKRRKANLAETLMVKYGEAARFAYQAAEKDTGTMHLVENGIDIEIVIPKKVTWDQAMLEVIAENIRAAGDDPRQYIKVKYDISEAAYKAWPDSIRKAFEPARTLEPGKATFTLSAKEA